MRANTGQQAFWSTPSHRPRPTEGCTGAFHGLNSEVMSLPPLITSSQNALAKTSNMALPDSQGPGEYSFPCLWEERELQSSWNFYIKIRACNTSSTAGSVLNELICSEPCELLSLVNFPTGHPYRHIANGFGPGHTQSLPMKGNANLCVWSFPIS